MDVTRRNIEQGLHELGLAEGDAVEVHASLSSFGRVLGGAVTVVDALMGAVGQTGTLVMSAYTVSRPLPVTDEDRARGVTWKVRILPQDSSEKTGMGAIVEEFRQRPGVVTGKGIHRVCAWGRDSERYAERGYEQLVDVDGSVLLLGVGVDRCSSLHLAARRVPLPDRLREYFTVPEEVRRAYPADVCIGYHEPSESPWEKAKEQADRRGLLREARIGQAQCVLFKVKPMLAAIEAILRTDPFAAFGLAELAGPGR